MKVRLRKVVNSKLFTLTILLVVIVVAFEILSHGMLLTYKNIRSILQSISVVTFLAIGCGMLLMSGNTDLSLGGVGTLGPMVLAFCLVSGLPWYLALLCSLIACALCGLGNAIMVNYLYFPTFIATIAMASISQGIAYLISGGKNIDVKDKVFNFIGAERLFNLIPYSFILAIIALAVYAIILNKTKFGRSIFLIGGNPEASRLAGLKPKKVSFILFINASCMACIGGAIMAGRIKTATCNGLSGQQFTGITAAILGGISFGGGNGGMLGALVGIMILNVFNNGMQLIGLSSYYQTIASGLLLLVALIYDRVMEIGKQKRALK